MFHASRKNATGAFVVLLGAALGVATLECSQPEVLKHSLTTGGAGVGGTGLGGSGGSASPGVAGDMGLAGDMGQAGMGLAGDMGQAGSGGQGNVGVAGNGAAGQATGAAGQGAAGQGAAGTGAAGQATGAAGQGAAGQGAAGAGAAGTSGTCNNSAVVTAGGAEATCTAKTTWKGTAMPTPPSGYLGINDMYLQPQYAIDGVAATRYSSGMTLAAGFYYQVDLGAAKMVSGITVDTNVGMDLMDVANGYDVGLSTDGTTFTTVATCAYNAAPTEVINFKATSARYVRYTNKAGPGPKNGATSWMSIHEFDIRCN